MINKYQEEHVLRIIDFLYKEMMSAGGDGDALWYSKYYSISDILPLLISYNKNLKFPLQIKLEEKTIYWERDQEGIIITNDESIYKEAPSWQQCLLRA